MTDRPTVVLLGASNLRMGLGWALAAARARLGPTPADFLVACGHGRSYVGPSSVLGRVLPGIGSSGLPKAWRSCAAERPALAVVTDVGNDVAYGYAPERIVAAVETVLDAGPSRLDLVVTLPPRESLRHLGPLRFHILRWMLFRGRSLRREDVLRDVETVADGLRVTADRRGGSTIEPEARWFGPDLIHYRPRFRREVWLALLGLPLESELLAPMPPIRRPRPARMTWLGREVGQPQPSVRWPDGSTVGFF